MKIKEMNIGGFGVWNDLSVVEFPDQVTVFYGRNEAGKTTLMQFMRSVLYGFPEERRKRYVPPVYGGLAGGSLEVENETGRLRIQRHIDPVRLNHVAGDLALTEPGGEVHGTSQLALLIGGVDELTFNNVFAVGLREIQELGSLDNTDAAEQLYKLTSGFDRVSLVDVMRQVEKEREELWNSHAGKKSVISDLLLKQKRLSREVDDLSARGRRWTKLATQSSEIEDQLRELKQQLIENETSSRLVEMAIQIRDRWNSRRLIDEQIQSYGSLPDASEISIERLDELNRRIADQKGRISQVEQQRRDVAQKAKSLPINRVLWANASRIEALQEHSPWIRSMQRQIGEMQSDVSRLRNEVGGQVEGIGQQLKKSKPDDIPQLSAQSLESLRTPARQLKEIKNNLAEAEKDCEATEAELAEAENELQAELERRGCHNLDDSLDVSGRLVNRLRKRVQLEQKLDKHLKDRKRMERDLDAVVREQLLPTEKLVLIGALCVMGVFFTVGGIFLQPEFLGDYPEALGILIGSICLGIAYVVKNQYNQIAKEALDDCQSQLELLKTQIRRTREEKNEVDRELPDDVAHHESNLEDAENELARLEDILPLEKRTKEAQLECEQAKRTLTDLEESLLANQKKWRAKLRSMGLPENLAPIHVKELLDRTERITGCNLKIQDRENEMLQKQHDLNQLEERIRKLMQEVDLEPASEDPVQRLEQLEQALAQEKSLIDQRKSLATDYRGLRKQLRKRERELEKLQGSRHRMLARVGADSEDIYRDFSLKHDQIRNLSEKRETLCDQISAALGSKFTEPEVSAELESYGGTALESRWESLQNEFDTIGTRQSRLNQQLGEHQQEMRILAEDRRLDEARLELETVKCEISQSIRHWQVTATTSCLLESIREVYEQERQPETLKEASEFLCQISGGQYTRIWTKLSENILLVDNADGESLPVEVLSRGTRECVYLGLRLALVTAYSRRGAVLPLILDDVLVNFDADRAREAALALKNFSAKGFQVMMFTCHDHIRDMFMDLECDVRELPHHA
ncbi:MAG: AAA family ATPase, partial [Planctomycetota bacterium]|nr:AAA family ATPase [Planctomycetota bacterium]